MADFPPQCSETQRDFHSAAQIRSEDFLSSVLREQSLLSNSSTTVSLVLDLDEILVSVDIFEPPTYDFRVEYTTEDDHFTFFIQTRPRLMNFLLTVSERADLFLFTRGSQEYADAILSFIDPQQTIFRDRFYKKDCVRVDEGYLRDLRVINRPLERMLVVEQWPSLSCLQPVHVFFTQDTTDPDELDELRNVVFAIERGTPIHEALGAFAELPQLRSSMTFP